ncbi:MAG TPA: rhamnulokinase family protein [Chloroflexota bacterium]|nr:rhamnulokinase family protein [Chloroflexota bacterium]
MASKSVLAVDLGAESGRVMAVQFNGRALHLTPLYRFPNQTVSLQGTLYWDVLDLWREIQAGIEKAKPLHPASVGVDGWGVDFGLLDRQGHLIGNVVQYRDGRTQGMMELAFDHIGQELIYSQTGIQFARVNTLYQLLSMVQRQSPLLEIAHTFLTVPDLFHYWLSGTAVCEFTIASTTQLLNPRTQEWAADIMAAAHIPSHIFPPVVPPGTQLGQYQGIPVITPASHDTGSAVAAVPAVAVPATHAHFAYISSGTWSLVGLEVSQPIITEAALRANITNEGGVYGSIRLLKNVMGLWLAQQCRDNWARAGRAYSYGELETLATAVPPLLSLINPDDPIFLPPGDHQAHIRHYCRQTNQPVPQSAGATMRCILESLALAYRDALGKLTAVSGQQPQVIHIVGGGSRNALLNQMTANATGLPVIAGPVEASIIGNAIVQLIALGELRDLAEARQLLSEMPDLQRYEPRDTAVWSEAYDRYQKLLTHAPITNFSTSI